MKRIDEEHGFVAIEWVAAVAMLLLPVVVLVATLPTWAERRHAATVAAREAARDLQQHWPAGNATRPSSSRSTSPPTTDRPGRRCHGARARGGVNPGDQIRVEVDVRDAGDRGARSPAGRGRGRTRRPRRCASTTTGADDARVDGAISTG